MTSTAGTGPQSARWLIVNGDDFGASEGVNRGIVDAFDRGVLTSASLMVTMPAAERACRLAATRPGLSLGIHIDLTGEGTPAPVSLDDLDACAEEIADQIERFRRLTGRTPSHVDAHHNVFRRPDLTPLFASAAAAIDRPLRENSRVRYFSEFYGQWDDGMSHPEWIGVENLLTMLADRIRPGITELACHPGYVDPALDSTYHTDREVEVATLCDPRVREFIESSDIELTNYDRLPMIDGSP